MNRSGLQRKTYLVKRFLGLILLVFCLFWPANKQIWAAQKTSIGEHFVGETLAYNVGFLWFDKVVHCVINLQRGEKPGEYVAILWGQTQGLVGWLTSRRERLFLSYLEEVDDGQRFRPLHFEKRITSGTKTYREEHDFDYSEGQWLLRTYKNNHLQRTEEKPLPAASGFNDILSVFYNFRYGVYGPIVRGQTYTLPAFSKNKGLINYKVRVLTQQKQDQYNLLDTTNPSQDYLVRLKVDSDIFGAKNGILWVWLSPNFVPQGGLAEDAIGFGGDIYGKIKGPKPSKQKTKTTLPSFLKLEQLFPQGLQ